MNAAEIIARLKAVERTLRSSGLHELYLFGSASRGDAGPGSDIDLAFVPGRGGVDLWGRAEILAVLAGELDREVDLVDLTLLRDKVAASAAADMRRVF